MLKGAFGKPLVTCLFLLAAAVPLGLAPQVTEAGSFFLTGHDPDFHAIRGGNTAGAQKINQVAIAYVMDPAFNPFVAAGATKFLFVESKTSPPGGHTRGVDGIVASGFGNGTAFDHHDATSLNAAIDQLGVTYGAVVVASDYGGILRQAELNILLARASDIINFLNRGGGLYAMAESNGGAHLTPGGGQFGYLPFVVSSTAFDQTETGITLTPFGQALGLANTNVNGNASHNVFLAAAGLNVVDVDRFGNILSLAGRLKDICTEPGNCEDNNVCTVDTCDVDTGLCRHERDNEGRPCNDATGVCRDGQCESVQAEVADIDVLTACRPIPPCPHGTVSCDIHVFNRGPRAVPELTVVMDITDDLKVAGDPMPLKVFAPGGGGVGMGPPPGAKGQQIVWTAANVPAGGKAATWFTLQVGDTGGIKTVSATGSITDLDPANNIRTDLIIPNADLCPPDIFAQKAVDPSGDVCPTDELFYVMVFQYPGATTADVIDELDPCLDPTTVSALMPEAPVCSISGSTIMCTNVALDAAGRAQVSFSAKPFLQTCEPGSSIENQATVRFTIGEDIAEEQTNTIAGTLTSCSCGDGTQAPNEQCDDGNTTSGDGCSATCQAELDHFKCYKTKPAKGAVKFTPPVDPVTLADAYETKTTTVIKPDTFCNPVSKNGEPINDPTAHLRCYKIKDVKGQAKFPGDDVASANQFGPEQVRLTKAATLCVPSEKDGVASALNLDHFKCYKATTRKKTATFTKREVSLQDQFFDGPRQTLVDKPVVFCGPVSKNGEGIRYPDAHLRCYKIKDAKGQEPFAGRDATITNQFGEEMVSASKPKLLCVPSSATSATEESR